ncbi:protein split ends-like isoform X2 [Eriocheir sinensis]|uniref:protein split ends-like isoform X2 n=1 Tax=Eriocheir sinensis TaxID=95602 RepID=UPI0021C90802|nr:protein split ends-like isoform X2 [Eriocheir sinensis]
MADLNYDPMQGEQGGEDGTLGTDIPDEVLDHYVKEFEENDESLSLHDLEQYLDDPGELAIPQEPSQPEHPSPSAPERPHSQGKFEKRCVISKVGEMAVAGVDGLVPETDEEVPMCDSVPKAFDYMGATKGEAEVPFSAKNINLTALDGDKGVPIWTSLTKTNMGDSQAGGVPTSATSYPAYSGGSLPETGVPTSATSYPAYSGGSLPETGVPTSAISHQVYIGTSSEDSAVPMNAGIETEVPAITSANPSTELQGARTGSQHIAVIEHSDISEMYSSNPPTHMSSPTLDFFNQGGTQTSNASNTVPGNGRQIIYRIGGTNIKLPINMSFRVFQSGTDNGTTGGVPPNPTVGTLLMSNQPSISMIDLKQNTGRKIKEEKEDKVREEEEEEKDIAGGKRHIDKTQEENKRNKRRRQTKKQTEEEEEEKEKVPCYMQKPSEDPEQERKRKDAIRAKNVRDKKKNRMAELEKENKELKEKEEKYKEETDRLKKENEGLKEKEEKHKEEIDRLKKENEGLTAQVQGWRTWVAELLTVLREQFNIMVASFGTPGP